MRPATRTENDLRQAFEDLASTAPAPDQVLAGLPADHHPPVRRGRTPLVIGAVLATTAAAVLVPVLVQRDDSASPAARPADSSPWRDRLSLPLPEGLIYDSRGFTREGQGLILDGGNSRTTCVVRTYSADTDLRTTLSKDSSFTINGTPGYRTDAAGGTLAWKPSDDRWGSSSCTVRGKADIEKAKQIAELVDTTPRRLPAPYKIGYLPAGSMVDNLSVNPQNKSTSAPPNNFIASVADGKPNTTGGRKPAVTVKGRPAQDLDLRIVYAVQPAGQAFMPPTPTPDVTVNGRDAWYEPDGLLIKGDGFTVTLDNWAGLPRAELLKVANGLELVGTISSTETWFDAATAIP